jgi:hypothetical protein
MEKLDMKRNAPLSKWAKAYADKLFPCDSKHGEYCGSYGACSSCCDRSCFEAGYNFGFWSRQVEIDPEFEKVFAEHWEKLLA